MMVWADGVVCVMSFWFYDIPLTHMTRDNCLFSLEL